jgi:cobalt-zinc-cadmium efflux system outer membrane protein
MMNKYVSYWFFAICLMRADVVSGDALSMQNTSTETTVAVGSCPSLTLEQAIQNALANNRALAVTRMRVEEAKARMVQAGLWPNPELELGGRFDDAFSNEGEYTYAAAINQPFSVSGRIGARKNVAQVHIERAQADVRDQERLTAAAVRTEFAELFAVKEQVKLQTFLVGLNDELLAAAQTTLGRGQAAEKDINAILISRQQSAQRLTRLKIQERSRLLQLNKLMGQPPQDEFIMEGKLTLPPRPDLSAFTLKQALQQRPDYAAAQLDVILAQAEQGLTKAERFEDWRIGVGYEQEQSSPHSSQPVEFVSLKLTVPLPVFDRKQGRLLETIAMGARTQKSVESVRIQIGQELTDAMNREKMLASLLESYQDGLLERTEDQLKRVEDGYRNGLTGMLDIIQSRQQFNDLKSSYIDTLRDYELALISLDSATGTMEKPKP